MLVFFAETAERTDSRLGATQMAKKEDRIIITLACGTCKRRNYTTMKNKRNDSERLEIKKFCKFCRMHIEHRETKK